MFIPTRTGLVRRADEVSAGVSDAELARLVRTGQLRRLHRGGYMLAEEFDPLERMARHAAVVRAALAAQRSESIVSHQSAAVLLGLPLWNIDLTRVHLIQTRTHAGRLSAHLHVHWVAPETVATTVVEDLLVTSPARTVADIAMSVAFEQAVVVADAALHRGLVSRGQLVAELEAAGRRRGCRRGAEVVRFADGRSESVGESRSRVGMYRAGLLMPDLQVEICDHSGDLVGRCDFCWRKIRLLGEFDGKVKLGKYLRPGEEPGDAVMREKQRQDLLADLDYGMTRWVWAELDHPGQLWGRVGAAIVRATERSTRFG